MASKSPTFLDRLSFSRGNSPILPMHNKGGRRATDYDLQDLSPKPEDALLRTPSPQEPWADFDSPAGSASKQKPKVFFAGPPPPIAASMIIQQSSDERRPSRERGSKNGIPAAMASSRVTFGSVLFDRDTKDRAPYNPDSVWRGLQRREKAIEKELQQLLDMQASGLVAGGEPSRTASLSPSASVRDAFSDTGSSTPTGTFYSTATSRSRMVASLNPPTRASSRGDIIPIRQPRSSRPQGLRTARTGLQRAMADLADLKAEEDAHVISALSQRKKALAYLRKLAARRERISGELEALANDDEEPLARELSDLGTQHESLSQEIREMEEKLVGMRNRRRWLEGKMDDVRNRREAGLSGYRGALKEVEGEVATLMRRPPIQPLDVDFVRSESGEAPNPPKGTETSLVGVEFLRLIPPRRTIEMAREWWEGEIEVLEKRKAQVDKAREALEQGADIWQETIKSVTDFESSLRGLVKGDPATKGKGKAPTQEEVIRAQLPKMGAVIAELEERLKTAETNRWNLLICAIGAELEAFKEAESMLQSTLMDFEDQEDQEGDALGTPNPRDGANNQQLIDVRQGRSPPPDERIDESDNEVPPDLLVSHLDDQDETQSSHHESPRSLRKTDSDNDVPPEFLAEHRPDDEEVD